MDLIQLAAIRGPDFGPLLLLGGGYVLIVVACLHERKTISELRTACKSCGYAFAGLPQGAQCPECGGPGPESPANSWVHAIRAGAGLSTLLAMVLLLLGWLGATQFARAGLAIGYMADGFSAYTSWHAPVNRELYRFDFMAYGWPLVATLVLNPMFIHLLPARRARVCMVIAFLVGAAGTVVWNALRDG